MAYLTLLLLLLFTGLVALYFYRTCKPNYWHERGVPHSTTFESVTNAIRMIVRRKTLKVMFDENYTKHPGVRYSGFFNAGTPFLMIKDPEIIKTITVKDFDYFVNRRVFLSEEMDPLLAKSIMALKDQRWKDMRSTLSPSFTANKMRLMFTLILECSGQFVDYFTNKIQSQRDEPLIVEMKDAFTRFTNDVIASTAFGLKVDSLHHPKNEFYMTGRKMFGTTFRSLFVFLGYTLFPELMKKIKIRFMPTSVTSFFTELILNTMETREKEQIVRPDMIHLLMEAKKGRIQHENAFEIDENNLDAGFATVDESKVGKEQRANKPPLSDEDLIAQAFLFFIGGFETSSTVMCFTAHELALNTDCQTRLQAEIDQVLSENDGKLTYESLNAMKYMDMVVSESLRKWNPAIATDRICRKQYTLPSPFENEPDKSVTIDAKTGIWIPISAIHHDPRYYSNPDKFDPERFSDENKHKIKPFTYIPFGIGPRSCIASRFALMEVKIILFNLFSKFDLVVCKKTKIPLEVDQSTFNLAAKGLWFEIRSRNIDSK